MTLKETIESIIFEEADVTTPPLGSLSDEAWLNGVGKSPERIIAAFRTALLSDEAVEAGAKAIASLDWDTGELGFQPTANDIARTVLTSALDAITGQEGEGE